MPNPDPRPALPAGKLPPDLLARLLPRSPQSALGARVRVGPGLGMDAAVLEFGGRYVAAKSDPITFATDEIGWYAVNVNANDLACLGAQPEFFLATLLLPEQPGNGDLAEHIFSQINQACAELGALLVGGHTEITHDLNRPIVVGAMLGQVDPAALVTAAGAQPGDAVLLTKGYPIEAVSIIAREAAGRLAHLEPAFLERCRNFLRSPGISVVRDARLALAAGRVTAMHDPTEGGLATGLWELAEASGHGIEVDLSALPLLPEGARLCQALGLDPLGCLASGALLLTAPPAEAERIQAALKAAGLSAPIIGRVTQGGGVNLPRFDRDEIARIF